MFKSLVLKSVIFKHFRTHWSYKQVTNLFTRVPFSHPRCQGNLEHGVALHDLPQTEKNGTDFPDTEDPRLCLHQRSLVFLKDHGKWRHFLCMLLLKYFYIYTGGIIHSQLWLASPWQGREIKMCWINLNSEVKKKKKKITKSLTMHCPFHLFEYKIQNVQFAYMNTYLK